MTNTTPGAELSALLEQLQTELKGDKGWDYTEYEKGRIAEKERTISLLQALARELPAASSGEQSAVAHMLSDGWKWDGSHWCRAPTPSTTGSGDAAHDFSDNEGATCVNCGASNWSTGTPCTATPPDQFGAGEGKLRELLAIAYAGTMLYTDDGELSDSRAHPPIDFLRYTPEQIESAMQRRAALAAKAEGDGGEVAIPSTFYGIPGEEVSAPDLDTVVTEWIENDDLKAGDTFTVEGWATVETIEVRVTDDDFGWERVPTTQATQP